MSPFCSASGRNCSGRSRPRCGSSQRSSASAPTVPRCSSTWLWKCRHSCCACNARLRSLSSITRASSPACITGSKKRTVPRPAALAWYIATSARLISSSSVCSRPRNRLTPMLGVTLCACSPRRTGWPTAARIFSPTTAACVAAVFSLASRPTVITTNSSPPMRATVSSPRTLASRRRPTSCSSRSPWSWPRVSLRTLKWSRSMKKASPYWPWRALLAQACCRRSNNMRRFGRPVSGS